MSQPEIWGVPRTDSGQGYTPEQYASRDADSLDALLSLHKGPSRPSYATAGTMWLDDNSTPWTLKLFDGSDDITIGTVNPSDNKFTPSRAVLYEAQTLSSGQQAQARANIAALSYDSQSLDSGQQAQARANIGLGNSATRNVGTTAGTVAAGDDGRITGALQHNTDRNLTAGFTVTAVNDGTKTSGTYSPSPNGGQYRKITRNGAFTLAAPSADGCFDLVIDITNGSSAGAVTFSGFASGYPRGDALVTDNGAKFKLFISKTDIGVTAFVERLI